MTYLDIDRYLERISTAHPTGLDYDNEPDDPSAEYQQFQIDFAGLDTLYQGEPDRYTMVKDPSDPTRDIEKILPGKEADARAVLSAAENLLEISRDLRIVVKLTYAGIRLHGLQGFAEGLKLATLLLEQYWEDVYPQLDAEDNNDPQMRINALNDFSDRKFFIRALKNTCFVEARAVGRFTLRDIDILNGDDRADEGMQGPSLALIQAACNAQDPEHSAGNMNACKQILDLFEQITHIFNLHDCATPDFNLPKKMIRQVLVIYQQALGNITEENVGNTGAQLPPSFELPQHQLTHTNVVTPSQVEVIASRTDAKYQLEKVCNYLEVNKPAHPSSLLVRRAIKLLDMNFIEIIAELTPDASQEIRNLAGIRDD